MKKKNQGFIATAVLYSLVVLVLIVLFVIFQNLKSIRFLNKEAVENIKQDLAYYEVIYNGNEHTEGAMENSRIYVGKENKLSKNSYIREKNRFEFQGWAYTPDGAVVYQDEEILNPTTSPSLKVDLYAIWKQVLFDVSFDANGGVNAPEKQIKKIEEPLKLTTAKPTRPNHVFVGWSRDPAAKTAEFKAGEDFTIDEDTTLYAVWILVVNYPNPGFCVTSSTLSNSNGSGEWKPLCSEGGSDWTLGASYFAGYGTLNGTARSTRTYDVTDFEKVEITVKGGGNTCGGNHMDSGIRFTIGGRSSAWMTDCNNDTYTLSVNLQGITGQQTIYAELWSTLNWNYKHGFGNGVDILNLKFT